jgi:outer membrane protein OmpA-like peptidoglycan-associated protein
MADPPEQSAPLDQTPAGNAAAKEAAIESAAVAGEAATQHLVADQGPVGKASPSAASKHDSWGVWTLLVRLVVLGLSISFGWVLGVLVAQVFPANNPDPPLPEVAMRRTGQTWRKLQRLPQWWRGDAADSADLDPAIQEQSPSPPTAVDPPRLTLSPELQEQVEADLALLQADLEALEGQLTDLESSLGEPPSGAPLETRLENLEALIRPPTADSPPATLPPPPEESAVEDSGGIYQEPAFSLVTDSIVLPSALLFEPEGSLLTPAGQQLLDTIVPDLRRYPDATLLVGSHGAMASDPLMVRKLTFQQAMAVQRYLDQQLGDTGVHWVTLGYGQSRPRVAGAGPEAQQRNRRVEIGIVPR